MTTHLLDANVLIALVVAEHEHHETASDWLAAVGEFAVCPVVEGALVRFLLRLGETPETAAAVLTGVSQHPRCRFWPDSASYRDIDLADIRGHRQVTDTYLAALARVRDGRLATLDRALAARFPEVAVLIGA